jgi:hypothetical protein
LLTLCTLFLLEKVVVSFGELLRILQNFGGQRVSFGHL